MKRILGITMLLALTITVWGQTPGNPFELKYRTPKVPVTKPVEIPKPDTPVISPPPEPTKPSKVSPVVKDTVPSSSKPVHPDTLPSGASNPFEKSTSTEPVQPADTPKVAEAPPMETARELIPPGLKKKSSRGFQIFFVLLSLLFLIFIVNVERSFVRDLWRVISNENYSSLHHRNQRNTMRQILLIMGYAVFIMQAGLYSFFALEYFRYSGPVLTNIWVTTGIVLGIYLIRHAVIRYLRWLFNNDKEMTLFGFDISIFNTMVGLILLPINILLIFGPDSIYKPLIIIGIIAIVTAYFMRQLRWVLTARHMIAHSLFLFFVYLCAVEILPLWAISKLFW